MFWGRGGKWGTWCLARREPVWCHRAAECTNISQLLNPHLALAATHPPRHNRQAALHLPTCTRHWLTTSCCRLGATRCSRPARPSSPMQPSCGCQGQGW